MPDGATIKAPLPGTFYRQPNPDAEPYVAEGDEVKPGDVVALIEVMKSYYEVRSEQAGVVSRFLVQNGDPIEAGQDIVALGD